MIFQIITLMHFRVSRIISNGRMAFFPKQIKSVINHCSISCMKNKITFLCFLFASCALYSQPDLSSSEIRLLVPADMVILIPVRRCHSEWFSCLLIRASTVHGMGVRVIITPIQLFMDFHIHILAVPVVPIMVISYSCLFPAPLQK